MPAVALALALTGCSFLSDSPRDDDGDGSGAQPSDQVGLLSDETRLTEAVVDLLGARAAAVRRGDVGALAAAAAPAARAGERRRARNLAQLPLQAYAYDLDDAETLEVVVDDDEVRVRVDLATRLRGLDGAAVVAPHDLVLTADAEDTLQVVSETPVLTDPSTGGPQPWDDGAISVVRRAGVLGVVDAGTDDAAAERVVEATAGAADDVAGTVPYRWSGALTLYVPADTALMGALAGLDPGAAERLDGVTFGVRGLEGPVVAERVVLHPRMLEAGEADLARLLRHELSHVALGARDEGVPRWLSEGIAEWVSVQPLPLGRRLISAEALRAARQGVTELPGDDGFNGGPRSGADYGIAWQVCEEIVAVYGQEALWRLLEAMRDRGGADPDAVLRRVLGTTGAALATEAGDRIVAAYG